MSKAGLLERALTFALRSLVDVQIWDDPVVDIVALAITPDFTPLYRGYAWSGSLTR